MLLDLIGKAVGLFRSREGLEPWMSSEEAFEDHFGRSYEDFAIALANLDQAHSDLYEKTAGANPEAAVVWVFYISQ